MNEALRRDIENFVEENTEAIFRDIARLVAINSVEGEPEPGAPFGPGPRAALTLGLQIARELGLEAVDCEGKIGYAALGEGEQYLATITHLDVVPTGDGWKEDPFIMREREGYIIGRGVMDDKGPSVLCLYALKYLKERNIPLRYPVRALLGANEETGMKDVEYYLANYPAPLFCFSPDANFPLCNGEKGIYHGRILSKLPLGQIVDIRGGVAANAIPDKAEAWVKAAALAPTEQVEAEETEPGLWHLTAHGIGGHASMPAGTVNALALIVEYLLERGIPVEEELPYFRFIARLLQATDGSGFGLQSEDDYFTPLTAVGGKITTEDGVITQTIDCRYGITVTGEKITSALKEAAVSCADIFVDADNVPFYAALDNPAIQACIESYNLITGENARPITIGGGTYARHFPSAAAFGPEHPERPMPDFCGPIHGINEAARKSDFFEALKIYIVALLRLEALDY